MIQRNKKPWKPDEEFTANEDEGESRTAQQKGGEGRP